MFLLECLTFLCSSAPADLLHACWGPLVESRTFPEPPDPPRPLWRASQPEVHINHYCSMSWLWTKPLNYTMWHVCCVHSADAGPQLQYADFLLLPFAPRSTMQQKQSSAGLTGQEVQHRNKAKQPPSLFSKLKRKCVWGGGNKKAPCNKS